MSSPTFASTLREVRLLCRLSQSGLALRAGFDHSHVSRLESGGRNPTHKAVVRLARAMELNDIRTDQLLASAGYLPESPENLIAGEPVVGELLEFLQDVTVSAEVRDDVRNMAMLLVRQARRVALERSPMGGGLL